MLNISKLKCTSTNNYILQKNGEFNSEIKYYPSSTKEWFDSVYNYNKNNEKTISGLDIMVFRIIKHYFNIFSNRLERAVFLRKKSFKKRRYRLNKVLVSRPEFKHTNDKLIITLYVYNRELSFLKSRMNKLRKNILAQYFNKILVIKYITIAKLDIIKSLIRRINILKSSIKHLKKKRLSLRNLSFNYKLLGKKTIKKLYERWSYLKFLSSIMRKRRLLHVGNGLSRLEYVIKRKRNFLAKKLRFSFKKRKNNKLSISYINSLQKSVKIIRYLSVFFKKINGNTNNINIFNKYINNIPFFSIIRKSFFKKVRRFLSKIRLYMRYNRIIKFNVFKFNYFLLPLKVFLEKIYKKEVEFNIISLKDYHLNSSILMQILTTKLRNRKNKLAKVLNKGLSNIKTPTTRKYLYFEEISRDKILQNIILKKYINNIYLKKVPFINLNTFENNKFKLNKISYIISNKDKLDLLLKSLYPIQNTTINANLLKINENLNQSEEILENKFIIKRNLENIVLDSIKNKSISGIRIEASGRLSKRILATRSVLKIKQKGTIKDINSSYKGLSSVLLKGNLRSNSQFFFTKGKTRIGSFGLKGWINSV